MKVNDRLSMHLLLEKKKSNDDGKSPLFIRVTVAGSVKRFYLQIKFRPDLFDQKSGMVRHACPDAKKLNDQIAGSMNTLKRQWLRMKKQCRHKGERATERYLDGLTLLNGRHESK